MVTHDERQVSPLVAELLAASASYVGLIRDQLAPYQQQIEGELWELLHDPTKDRARRFRAGLGLATYAPTSPQWTPEDHTFLVEQLVAANPEHQPRLREYLRPLDNRLLGNLECIFSDPKATESQQLGAANALADFAAKDAMRLARLVSTATPGQYEILYPLVADARDAAARESLYQLVREVPAADLPPNERVPLGQRRAGAAISLLRRGEYEAILDLLRGDPGGGLRGDSGGGLRGDDPESLTQFVHRCRQRGILPAQLLECLKLTDRLRESKTGEARRIEDRAFYGLLLALGEFKLADLTEAQRDAFVEQLANWYANDGSSAVHGATGWLLRHWKQDELAKKVDQTPVPYDSDRQWFTVKFVVPPSGAALASRPAEQVPRRESPVNSSPTPQGGTAFCVTFVVFPAGEYLVGSAPDEIDRQANEARHTVKLTRPIAVSDREITWEQFDSFDDRFHHDSYEKQFSQRLAAEDPAFGVSWYEAVAYCRWLTKCAGMAEDDQAYADPKSLDGGQFPADPDPAAQGAPLNWPVNLQKRGFRLPTEAEWETVCRSGTNTAYSFGNDAQLLPRYGWFVENSEKRSQAVGRLRPNVRGLFDIQGNLVEWCHDWYGDYAEAAEDPTGPPLGSVRMHRGGGWLLDAAICRAAMRSGHQPAYRSNTLGFRVAAVPFSQASVPDPETTPVDETVGTGMPSVDDLLRKAITFYASFDAEPAGDFGQGDLRLGTRADDPAEKSKKILRVGYDESKVRVITDGGVS
ncbi:MAG TPA: formylglycine-generating enzyme family protein, partial [Pirellulales bacterium]|nr:formylglycine-generating enzyme family protein [Pirellulales bacterium]